MRRHIFLIVALIFLLTLSQPVSATSAEMRFHATCVPDTLHPGELAKLTVIINNDARANGFTINKNTSELLSIITTAYNVRANVSGELPFTVENSYYQLVGTIPQGRVGKAVFIVKVPDDAKPGTYDIPVELKYTQIVANPTANGFSLTYIDQVDTVYAKISIVKKDFDVSLKAENSLYAGAEGIVKIAVTNTGKYNMDNVSIIANVTPPFMPNAGSATAFLGQINPGHTKYAKIKLFVSSSAMNQTYPLRIIVAFTTPDGKPVMIPKQLGIKVVSKDVFSISVTSSSVPRYLALPPTSPLGFQSSASAMTTTSAPLISPSAMNSATSSKFASKQMASRSAQSLPAIGYAVIKVKDLGEFARDITVNVMFTNPLLTAVNNPYIGELKPGESKNAIIYIRSMAPEGTYKAYVVISYKNPAGDSVISKKYPIAIKVGSPPFKVLKIETKNLYVGGVGEVDVVMSGNISDATFFLVPASPSIISVSPSSYAYNSTSTLKFRVYIPPQEVDGYHCMYLVGRYDEGRATNLVSVIKVPVFVEPKTVLFRVTKVENLGLYPDETGTVKITVVNAGNTPVYNAVVELKISPPLSIAGESAIGSMIGVSTPGTYFIGTLKPGNSATASFRIKVDKHAGAGSYPANVRILYYDSNGYQHLSNSITVSVEVKNKPLLTPLTISALIFTLIGIVIAVRYARNRRRKTET